MAKKNKEKLKRILDSLSRSELGVDKEFKSVVGQAFDSVEKEMKRVSDKMMVEAEVKTVELAKKKIKEIKEQVGVIFDVIDKLKGDLRKSEGELANSLNQKLDALKTRMAEYRTASLDRLGMLSMEMDILKEDIREISKRKVEIPDFASQIEDVEKSLSEAITDWKIETDDKVEEILTEMKDTVSVLENSIKKLRTDTMSVIASKGGGNANRNILVSNNPSTLGRYTDLNIKAGANVTLTYTNNDNLKTTDLTIAATGGSGTSRNISTVTVSSVVADTASTDIVIIAGAGIKLTMPTAVGNTNLYTIKNKAASSVLIVADGAETIDDSGTALMETRYTAIDLISDNANWHIT